VPRLPASAGRFARVGAALLAAGIGLSACSSTPDDVPDRPTVTIFGPFRDEAADLFRASLAPFEERSGIDVVFTGSGDFESEIVKRLEGGAPPDIAVFPQPGLLNQLAASDYVVPLPAEIAAAAQASYRPGIEDLVGSLAEVNGVVYRVNVKSLVWHSPAAFEENGYRAPTTWSELRTLASRMVADGFTPWCLGVEAFGASGWPGTDWIEEIVLRDSGPGVYDQWVRNEVPFTDDAVRAAFATFGDMLLSPDQTLGGRGGVLNTNVQRAGDPLLDDPRGCLMYRQASFQVDNLPSGTSIGPDGDLDVFVLPAVAEGPAPLVVGGTIAAALTDAPEVWQVMAYLATAEAGLAWAEAGGFISPHAEVGPADYPNTFDGTVSALLDEAEVVRFDASDLMDPRVGADSFFGAVLYYIGTLRLEDALEIAQAGYQLEPVVP
jgi:alpha-glucoside transport system substrate-binding protein